MSTQSEQIFELPAHLDLNAVDAIRDWLMSAMEQGDVELKGESVERVYANCLLLLVAASDEAKSLGRQLSVTGASDALRNAIERLGFGKIMSDLLKD